MEFKDKVIVITGGAKGIGKAAVEEFRRQGANVALIDILDNDYFVGYRCEITKKIRKIKNNSERL